MATPRRRVACSSTEAVFYALGQLDGERLLVNDAVEALLLLPGIRAELDQAEMQMVEMVKKAGLSWDAIAAIVYGGVTRQTAEKRYRRLGGKVRFPTGPTRL